MTGGKADFRYLIDSYLEWAAGQQIPVVEGLGVDLDSVATAPWGRLGGGCRGALVHLQGRGDFLALQLIELPPGAQMDRARHLYDEVFYVLSGRGRTSIEADGSRTFEWGPRALFSPPLNAPFRLANFSRTEPARLICGNNLPFLMNVFRNERFVFDHPFPFPERVGRAGAFAGDGDFLPVAPGRHMWETCFIPDLAAFDLPEWEARGAGNRNINIILSDSSMHAHVSEMPAGTYTKGRRHDAGVHVMAISGAGYTLVWKEGDTTYERLELRPGSIFALTQDTLHQHFNPGAQPLRYLAISIGSDRYPMLARKLKRKQVFDASLKDGGLQIDYQDQDPRIHAMWHDEIASTGAASRMEQIFGQSS